MRKQYRLGAAWVLIVMTTAAPFFSGPSRAQVDTSTPPTIEMTSPLGGLGAPAAAVGPAGIPLGAVELSPGGLSPAPLGPLGSTSCSAAGMAGSVGMAGSGLSPASSSFDGGGMSGATPGAASAMPSTLSSGCGSIATGSSPSGSSAATPSVVGASSSRAGIPLGSTEIGNLGTSPTVVVPGPILTPVSPMLPTVPAFAPPTALSRPTSSGVSIGGAPCGSASGLSAGGLSGSLAPYSC